MIKFDFMISNILLLSKCLGFADISADVVCLNIYTKNGRVLMAAGEKIKVVVDTLIDIDEEIDIYIDCKKFIEYISYIKNFSDDGSCSMSLQDNSLQILDNDNDKIKNELFLEYIVGSMTKIRAINFNKLSTLNVASMREGMNFVATAADGSEKYSSQLPSVLIKIENGKLMLAGTDSVKCCIYTEDMAVTDDSEVIIPSNMARAISNMAVVLNKDAYLGYSSTYFKCCFGNVSIYSSIINTGFPSLTPLLSIDNEKITVSRTNIINILRGANISTKGKQDKRLNISVVGSLMRIYSIGFDSSMVLDESVSSDEDIALNSFFIYNLCSLFKSEDVFLQLGKQVIKITDKTSNKIAFLATLK